mmetsp:Transcript_35115/g.98087  ORF Transcript_35115/g.98087 Transcript_35115/m.98087 type:complete len:291 (-) Transcript_35115:72-944(-)
MAAQIVDIDEERLLRHFCLDAECKQVFDWLVKQGHPRPDGFHERLALAADLREKGNRKYQASDFTSAMMFALGALHCIDFSQAKSMLQSEDEKQEVLKALLPVMSNLSVIFLKRGDAYNAVRSADLGIDRAKKYQQQGGKEADALLAKLLFRRGQAKAQKKDFAEARTDLREAARLMPADKEIRKLFEQCKAAASRQSDEGGDAWRGVLTETPQQSLWRARCLRRWKQARSVAAEFVALMRGPDGTKAILLLIGGPLLSYGLRSFAMQYAAEQQGGVAPAPPAPPLQPEL